MLVLSTIDSLREYRTLQYPSASKLGLVPTMGALHKGHLSLVEKAMTDNDSVAVSIFVNPIQFNNPVDLNKYPRTMEKDLAMLDQILKPGDMVFAPSTKEMYPEPITQEYDFGQLAAVMEGEKRPGHFNGVGIVVNKLLRIIEPHTAYFGEKDFQQLVIIRELIRIESLPVGIVGCPIIRESDGLAMSSRNARLKPEERAKASEIYHSLKWAREQFLSGENPGDISGRIIKKLDSIPGFKVEYLTFANESTLNPITQSVINLIDQARIRCFIAVFVGDIRLIDNLSMN